MSYKEKTIWLTLAIMLVISYNYFTDLSYLSNSQLLNDGEFGDLLAYTAMYITVSVIIAHIILAIIDHKNADEQEDERDEQIELRANRIGYTVLCIAVVGAIFQSQLTTHFNVSIAVDGLSQADNVVHLIICGLLIAEIANYGAQIFYYRRGF